MTWSTAPETAPQAAAEPPWHHVRVHWPDGTSHLDGIRGWDEQHAIDAAQWNWGTANPHGTCERVEYLGPEADDDTALPPNWAVWSDDTADTADDDAGAGA